MNKSEFINRLEKALGGKSWEEKKEIIYDYEEYFQNATSEGKTEIQIVEELGNPEEIALNYLNSQPNSEKESDENSNKSQFSKIINKFVNSALKFASTSIGDALSREEIEISSLSETKNEQALILEITKCKSACIKIRKHDQDNFKGELVGKANVNPDKPPFLENYYDETSKSITFSINWQHQKLSSFSGDLTIYVPSSFSGKVNVESISGDLIEFPSNITDLRFKSVSGELKPSYISVINTLTVKSVSGDLKADKITCKNAIYESVSGDLTSNELLTSSLCYSSTSGDLKTNFVTQPDDIKIKTVSGDARVLMPSDAGINLYYKSISGELKSDFSFNSEDKKKKYGSLKFKGECQGEKLTSFQFKTVSGDLKLKKCDLENKSLFEQEVSSEQSI